MAIVADRCDEAGGGARSVPLGAAAGAGLAGRFHAWRGRSGRRYVVSVYPAEAAPDYSEAVVIAVRRTPSGRVIVAAAAAEAGCPASARLAGADEFHFHLLAATPEERQAVVDDLT